MLILILLLRLILILIKSSSNNDNGPGPRRDLVQARHLGGDGARKGAYIDSNVK